MQAFGAILLISAYFAYSLTSLLIYFLIDQGVPLILAFGYQNIFIVLILVARSLLVGERVEKPKNIKLIFYRALTGVVYSLSYFSALSYASFAEVGILTNSFPLFIVLIAWVFFGEKIGKVQLAGLLIGMVGVWTILAPNVHNFLNHGLLFATVASIFWAISLIIMQKVTDYEDVYSYLIYFFSFTLCLLMPFILYQFQFPTGRQIFYYGIAALISLLAQTLTFKAYKVASATELAPYNFSFAFFHFLLAKGIFSFIPSVHFYVGSILILASGFINMIIFERSKKKSPEAIIVSEEV